MVLRSMMFRRAHRFCFSVYVGGLACVCNDERANDSWRHSTSPAVVTEAVVCITRGMLGGVGEARTAQGCSPCFFVYVCAVVVRFLFMSARRSSGRLGGSRRGGTGQRCRGGRSWCHGEKERESWAGKSFIRLESKAT